MHTFQQPDDELASLGPARVEIALEDIEGGEPNLLPAGAWLKPLRVDVPIWPETDPAPGFAERLELYWDGKEIDSKSWEAPIPPHELFFLVPPLHLGEGSHVLHYVVVTPNGEVALSLPLTLTIDKTAPALGEGGGALLFPPEVIADGLTAQWLELNQDQVIARLPDYPDMRPGDTVHWYWDSEPFGFEWAGSLTLTAQDIPGEIPITFDGDLIRARGDGQRYVHYEIEDRAGNTGTGSRPVTLQVAATPLPRELPWLEIAQSPGGGEIIELDPWDAREGATVTLAQTVLIHPDEQVWVQWGEPGDTGAWRGQMNVLADPRQCLIPKSSIAAGMGKQLPLYYEVVGPQQTYPSERRQVRLLLIDPGGYPTVQCQGMSGTTLSLASVPAGGARLTLARWVLMSTDQMITIRVAGVAGNGQAIDGDVLHRHQVTAQELLAGIGADGKVVAPKALLAQLKRNQVFRVMVYVSFDGGSTWPPLPAPNFPSLYLTLVD